MKNTKEILTISTKLLFVIFFIFCYCCEKIEENPEIIEQDPILGQWEHISYTKYCNVDGQLCGENTKFFSPKSSVLEFINDSIYRLLTLKFNSPGTIYNDYFVVDEDKWKITGDSIWLYDDGWMISEIMEFNESRLTTLGRGNCYHWECGNGILEM